MQPRDANKQKKGNQSSSLMVLNVKGTKPQCRRGAKYWIRVVSDSLASLRRAKESPEVLNFLRKSTALLSAAAASR